MKPLAGVGSLLRLGLRLDRLRLTIWTLSVAGIVYLTASAFRRLYPTVESRISFARILETTPALVAFTGPPFDLRTIGGLTAWRGGGFGAVIVGLLGALTVVRHTRGEEENGRVELIGSGAVGRYAHLTAGLTVAWAVSLVIGLLVAGALISLGEPAPGAFALGLAFAGSGWVFASFAALTSQLTTDSRIATGMAAALLGWSFAARAIGDSAPADGPTWLSWWSPIGWSQQVRPFAGERWEVFGLTLGTSALFTLLALTMAGRRDMGAGLLAARSGPPGAGPTLSGPLGLAWRIHKEPLAGWAVGLGVLGLALGTVAESIGSMLDDNPQLRGIFEAMGGTADLTDAFFAAVMGLVGLLAGAYAIQVTLRLRAEEVRLRAEMVLATRVTRIGWALSHLAITAVGSAILLLVAGSTTGLVHGLGTGNVGEPLAKLLAAGALQLPAVFVLVGAATLLFGFVPRWSQASWVVLAACAVIAQLGPVLGLNQHVLNLSPYTHVPQIPLESLRPAPVLLLMAFAAGCLAVGLAGFRRRDIG